MLKKTPKNPKPPQNRGELKLCSMLAFVLRSLCQLVVSALYPGLILVPPKICSSSSHTSLSSPYFNLGCSFPLFHNGKT